MSPRKKINITLITYGICFASLIVFGISPLFKKIRENSHNLLTFQEEIALLDVKSQSFDTLRDSYEALGVEKKLDSFFIDSEIDTNFIEFLEGTAQDLNVSTRVSRYTFKKEKRGTWTSHGYAVSCNGFFQDILKLIGKLETSPYLLEIHNLEMAGYRDEESGTDLLSASFLIRTYSRPKIL